MRYLLIIVCLIMCLFASVARAQEEEGGLVSQILDTAKPSLLIDLKGTRLLGGITASVIDWRGLISLDVGGITDLSSNALLVGISGNVQALAEKYGLNFNLPDKLSVGSFLARDFGDKEFIYGLSLSYTIEW